MVQENIRTPITFADFSLRQSNDGYTVELVIENTTLSNILSLGWVNDNVGAVILETSEGKYSASYPDFARINPGDAESYQFNFREAAGVPEKIVLGNLYVLSDRGLPDFNVNNEYEISLN